MIEKIVHTAKQAVKEKVLIQSAMLAPGAVCVAGDVIVTLNLSPGLSAAGPDALASAKSMQPTESLWFDDRQSRRLMLLDLTMPGPE